MSVSRLARFLTLKYAAELINPDAPAGELIETIKNNLADIYRKFMPEYSGLISQINQSYKLPFLDSLEDIFSAFIANLDNLDIIQVNQLSLELIKNVEHVRVKLNDFIKTNKNDPAFTAFFMRKRLASTVDKVLEGLEKDLIRQLDYINATNKSVHLPTAEFTEHGRGRRMPDGSETTKRRRMEQTPQQTEMLVLRFGDLYGVRDMSDWGKLKHGDADLAEELMTAFLGLNRASKEYQKSEDYDPKDRRNASKEKLFLATKVKGGLRKRIEEFFSNKRGL
jgi:hypothetical protein